MASGYRWIGKDETALVHLSLPSAQSPDEKNKTSAQAVIDAMSDELRELLGIIPDRKNPEATSAEVDPSGEHRR
jgi:hypothetical protein